MLFRYATLDDPKQLVIYLARLVSSFVGGMQNTRMCLHKLLPPGDQATMIIGPGYDAE